MAAAHGQKFTLVHVFHGPDGGDPASARLVMDSTGTLYSTTSFGGADGLGTVYKIDAKKNETVLHSFTGGEDGENPTAGVALGSDGNLYGSAAGGGTNGFGTAFRQTPAGAFNAFYEFQGGTQASQPGRLIAGSNALFGTAAGGAPFYGGVVFRLDRSGETDLYKFVGGADGSNGSGLIRDNSGNLYGVAGGGDLACSAPGGCGTVFKIDAKGVYSVLHVFVGPDGEYPGGLAIDAAGNLYGTTTSGGAQNSGTIFKLTPSGQLTTIYAFTGGADGGQPNSVILDSAGNLYGTTYTGGIVNSQCFDFGCGLVFQLSPGATGAWKETVLHSFNGADGDNPLGPLLLDPNQPALYGTTWRGGDYSCTTIAGGTSCGVVFKITR
jgi:uncharacterized repeat protein (TIGR03803 family)